MWGWSLWGGLALGMGIARLLYESDPWRFGVFGQWPAALLCGGLGAVLWRAALAALDQRGREAGTDPSTITMVSLPALLAWLYVVTPGQEVDPLRGGLLLAGSVLLAAALALTWKAENTPRSTRITGLGSGGLAALAYLLTLQRTIGRADTFEFQVVGPTLGIAHPTGYPLYVLLGKLFSLLPLGQTATRVNLTSLVAAALSAALIALLLVHILKAHPVISGLGALAFALSPTFWSQAVIAEVYALHTALLAGMLLLAGRLIASNEHLRLPPWRSTPGPPGMQARLSIGLMALAGLGLTNHLTTVLLLPALGLAAALAWPRLSWKQWLLGGGLLAAALLIYLYIPLRWPTVTDGSPMPLSDFIGWVTGSRFAGALQLRAWLVDGERWRIMGRLLVDQYGWPGIGLGALGLGWLAWRQPRMALVTGLVFAAVGFYGLNYYVPDISVFVIPCFAMLAIWMACGIQAVLDGLARLAPPRGAAAGSALAITLLGLLVVLTAQQAARQFDWSDEQALEEWGRRVLALPLDDGAAILADSEKIAPLEYLHRIEGLRPDLEMVVLGSEAEYYEQINARTGAGQTVYLARFLPGLEGAYHLRSAGPLIEVGTAPLEVLPALGGTPHTWENGIRLAGSQRDRGAWQAGRETGITLVWQAPERVDGSYEVRLRLVDQEGTTVWEDHPAYAVSGRYPTVAWKPGEIIPDYHSAALPYGLEAGHYRLEAALAAPFTAEPLTLMGGGTWAAIGEVEVQAAAEVPPLSRRLALRYDGGSLTSIETPARALAGGRMTVEANWLGADGRVTRSTHALIAEAGSFEVQGTHLYADLAGSRLAWQLEAPGLRCGWLAPVTGRCQFAETHIEGETVAGALANFDNQMVLLSADYTTGVLPPGGEARVTLTWQGLRAMREDYTIFVQLIGPDGRPHGQMDTWPVQGTYPTSTWAPGEIISDPYVVRVDADAPPGEYQIAVGVYLLRTNQRLVLIGPAGEALDDKLLLPGLSIEGNQQ